MPDHIDAEPVDTPVQPKPHHLMHGASDVRIAPIQIRLLLEVRVIIVLTRACIELPGAASERAEPIIGRASVGGGISPDVPVALGIVPGSARFEKPGMS